MSLNWDTTWENPNQNFLRNLERLYIQDFNQSTHFFTKYILSFQPLFSRHSPSLYDFLLPASLPPSFGHQRHSFFFTMRLIYSDKLVFPLVCIILAKPKLASLLLLSALWSSSHPHQFWLLFFLSIVQWFLNHLSFPPAASLALNRCWKPEQ